VQELQGARLYLPLIRKREASAEDRAVGANLPLQASEKKPYSPGMKQWHCHEHNGAAWIRSWE
jgi:hypothetical protein